FNNQDSRENRKVRKVPLEHFFIRRNILVGDDIFAFNQFNNAVQQQKRVPVRQVLANFQNVHHTTMPLKLFTAYCGFFEFSAFSSSFKRFSSNLTRFAHSSNWVYLIEVLRHFFTSCWGVVDPYVP